MRMAGIVANPDGGAACERLDQTDDFLHGVWRLEAVLDGDDDADLLRRRHELLQRFNGQRS